MVHVTINLANVDQSSLVHVNLGNRTQPALSAISIFFEDRDDVVDNLNPLHLGHISDHGYVPSSL